MRKLLLILLLIFSVPQVMYSQTGNEVMTTLFAEIDAYDSALHPESLIFRGQYEGQPFGMRTEQDYHDQQTAYVSFRDRLGSVSDEELSRQEYMDKQTMLLRLNDVIDQHTFGLHMIPMNAEGGFYGGADRRFSRIPLDTPPRQYMDYLQNYSAWLYSQMDFMKTGLSKGIVAPKVVIENNLNQLRVLASIPTKESAFYKRFVQMEPGEEMLENAAEIIREGIIGFYSEFADFLATDYLEGAQEKPGIASLPGGKEYYESRMRFYSTLPMTPDSVHALGLMEVARIRASMDSIIQALQFDGSFKEFLNFLRTDAQFYAETPAELLNQAAWLSKRAEAGLPKLFSDLYSLPFTVEPVPDNIAPTYTGGRYVPGSWEQQRAGIYWVNTYKLEARPFYTLPSLTLHEAVPGHHLQIMLASVQEEISDFRRNYYISAFGEGWGLYSEYLGEEMGMYVTPYELFGRYTYEMWRACRLVVDTGIHYMGWTRDQAVDYMAGNTALSLHEVNTEINRYIGWPGQAVSYKIGEIKIRELRKRASAALGENFDVREFHKRILRNGSIPLSVLDDEIQEWINRVNGNK